MKLLTENNPKILKGNKLGYLSFILHLAPSDMSGYNTCPRASMGCRGACLNTAGRGGMFVGGTKDLLGDTVRDMVKHGVLTNVVQRARIRKTKLFFENRLVFMGLLVMDIEKAIKIAKSKNLIPCFRLNGTSDIDWENIPVGGYNNIMEMFPTIIFYDYSKVPTRTNIPANYHLTYSRSESNNAQCLKWLSNGENVTVVFRDVLPSHWNGFQVINGDISDLRFLDPKNIVVGLKAKGKAKIDASGFVVG
jgi:hypothetical protein